MCIEVHLYFNLLKLIYSFIYRRDIGFIILELLGSILTIAISLLIDKKVIGALIQNDFMQNEMIYFFYALFYGILYLFFSLLSRFTFKKNPEELAEIKNSKKIIPVGIIDFSWITLVGIVYAAILFCNNLEIISSGLKQIDNIEYYKLSYNEAQYLFNQTINLILVLGTILAACMTIIWSGSLWRKKDHTSRKHYKMTTIASIKMVIAFFTIVIAIVIWISLPLFFKMTDIKDFILTNVT